MIDNPNPDPDPWLKAWLPMMTATVYEREIGVFDSKSLENKLANNFSSSRVERKYGHDIEFKNEKLFSYLASMLHFSCVAISAREMIS